MPYTAEVSITPEQVRDQMVTAVEGGITYWCNEIKLLRPDRATIATKPWYDDVALYRNQDFLIEFHDYEDGRWVQLTPSKIRAGLKLLVETYPNRLAEILRDEGDSETADVFLQLCLFKEVTYG